MNRLTRHTTLLPWIVSLIVGASVAGACGDSADPVSGQNGTARWVLFQWPETCDTVSRLTVSITTDRRRWDNAVLPYSVSIPSDERRVNVSVEGSSVSLDCALNSARNDTVMIPCDIWDR